jgi:crotonobetainyl-CoA:carnitine CoA-transferase CaiB-like acyl-CoA transferase
VIYDGLRVVDCSTGIAGAYCAKLLTDLGADVVFGSAVTDDPLFVYLRTSQRHASDLEKWLASADIVIANEQVACNAYVTIVISALGHGGPDDGLRLTEEVLQARSGSLSAHGHADRPPLTVGGRLGEYIVGTYAALGALTALRRGQRGEVVDASMLEAIQMTYVTTPTLMARFPGGRMVSHRWVMIPGNEPAAGGRYVGITTITAQQWQALARVIGRDDMAADDELATMIGRYLRNAEVNAALHAYTEARDADDIVAACVEARVPVAIVGNGAELPRNEQLVARNVFVQQPGESWIRPRAPFRFHAVDDRPLAAPGVAERPWSAGPDRERATTGAHPLAGVRVLDFTAFWAGPHATAWFCAMGAEVIKVEAVQRPDGIRFSAAVRPRDDPKFYEKSALFHFCNLGKRGITLDLGDPEGLALAKRLVEQSDVIAENFTPQVMERFGLDWDTVHALNPGAIYLRMPAFGLDGPWRPRGGFAQTMEQLAGMAWVTGYEGGPPIIPGGPVDPMVGAHAALAAVAALEHRARTGAGQLVEVPLVEVATAVTAEQVIRYAIDGTVLGRRGEGGVYRCAGDDEWVAIDRASDPMEPEERAAWCAGRAPDAAAKEALARGIPAAAMVPGFMTLDDAQMRARGFFEPIVHPLVGEQQYPSWPVRLSGGPDHYWRGPAPMLGEHTHDVLRELCDVDDDELARLEAAHVIGTEPRMGA